MSNKKNNFNDINKNANNYIKNLTDNGNKKKIFKSNNSGIYTSRLRSKSNISTLSNLSRKIKNL